MWAADYIGDFIQLFYPDVCQACSEKLVKGEEIICFACASNLPYTGHWNHADNAMARRFWGRIELQHAAALFEFKKGSAVQHLLHALKYHNRQDVGQYLGRLIGLEIKNGANAMIAADLILPVPLHWKKQHKRGYNQCDSIARGMAETLQVAWNDKVLERVRENVSQTGKNRFERWQNVAGIFAVNQPEILQGKHILLVDDVMTTGATAEACLQALCTIKDIKLSFVTVAVAVG